MRPALTVIVSNYNHARYLPESLPAILKQCQEGDELIIYDDASTDDSVAVIEEHLRSGAFGRLIRNPQNLGIIENQSRGLAEARTPYIYFAASDDRILPGMFNRTIDLLSRHPEAGLCSSMTLVMDENGQQVSRFPTRQVLPEEGYLPPEKVRRELMRDDQWFMGNTAIFRRDCLEELDGFDPRLGSFADGFGCRLVALRHGCCFIPSPLSIWRRSQTGYALSSAMDDPTTRGIADEATALMTGRYAADFPAGYARRWRARWLFGARYFRMKVAANRGIDATGRALGRLGPPGKLLTVCIAGVLKAAQITGGISLFLVMRPQDLVPMLSRRARRFIGSAQIPE